jgi:hypothetical protein
VLGMMRTSSMDLNKDRMNDVNSLETQALVKEKKKVSFSLPVS